MIPIAVWLIKDFLRNPRKWLTRVSNKLCNKYEYHPDPSRVDPSRRRSPKDIETEILQELETEEA